ncbi:S-layer homology domain-containing protein [Paenibacillus terrigena]|uniref:S-layer homology domain-containing protein n=1 Tax=Paenibacillus terrigena TaxID=369333 RepID=UPI0028D07F1F|nr:S-layer homology domain-containing protein [Paenibacillus terrigena]
MKSKSMKHRSAGQKGIRGHSRTKRGLSLILVLGLLFPLVSMLIMPASASAATAVIKEQSAISTGQLTNVAFGNGKFVAVGKNRSVSTSTNGVDWKIVNRDANDPTLTTITFANGKFVAIDGTTSNIYTSADGETWSGKDIGYVPTKLKMVKSKIDPDPKVAEIDTFFAWRSDYKQGTNPPAYDVTLKYSLDGSTWKNTNITSTDHIMGMQSITDIAYDALNKRNVVSGLNATFYYSSNLSSWTTVTLTQLVINEFNSMWPYMNNVTYLKNMFFTYAAAFQKKMFTSTDGTNWSVNTSWDNNPIYGGSEVGPVGNRQYVLLGDQGRIYYTSNPTPQLKDWSVSDTKTSMMFDNIVYDDVSKNYIASGYEGMVVSSDLKNWKLLTGSLRSIVDDGKGTYVEIANNGSFGSIYQSTNAKDWNEVTPVRIPGLNAVNYGNGQFVAVSGMGNDGKAKILSSNDGVVWGEANSLNESLTGVATGAGKYVMVSDYGTIYSTADVGAADKSAWSKYTNVDYSFNTVTYLNNRFIALGTKYDSNYNIEKIVVARSSDGETWGTPLEVAAPDSIMTGIAYSGSQYVMVGQNPSTGKGIIYKSADLTTWNPISVNADSLNDVAYGNGSFLAVGNAGEMMSSPDGTTWNEEASNSASNLNGVAYDRVNFNIVGSNMTRMTVSLGPPAGAQSATAAAATVTPTAGQDDEITLTVLDAAGHTDAAFDGNKNVTITGVQPAPDRTYGSFHGTPLTAVPSTVSVNFVDGVAKIQLKLNFAAIQSIGFQIEGVAAHTTNALNMAPVAGSAASMKLMQDITAPSVNGGTFAKQPVVTLLDAFGNSCNNDNSTVVSVSKKDAGAWMLTGTLNGTAAAGVVTFTGLGATNDEGVTGAQLQFKAAGLPDAVSAVVNLPVPAGAQNVTAVAKDVNPGIGVDNDITLTVRNSLNKTDATFNGAHDVTVTGYVQAPNGSYGSLESKNLTVSSSTASVIFAGGVAHVKLALNKAEMQSIQLSVADVAVSSANAVSIAPVAGNADSMKLSRDVTAPTLNGAVFAQQPILELLDKYGNISTNDNSTVVTASQKDAGSWTLTGDATVTAKAGIVNFNNLGATNDEGVTGAQLQLQAAGMSDVMSTVVNLPAPAGAQSVTAAANNINPTVGTDVEITLMVLNSLGHTDKTFNGAQDVIVTGYQQAPDQSYGSFKATDLTASPNTVSVTFVDGVAKADLKLNKSDAQTIDFRITSVAKPDTNSLVLTLVAGNTASMELTKDVAAPASNGGVFVNQPVVTLYDTYGNVSEGDNSTIVTATIKDAGAWKLTGTMTATAQAGIVTFSGLGATNPAEVIGAQLAFNAEAMPEVLSAVVDLPWPSLTAPSIESVTAGDGHVLLQWSAMYGSVSYAVYQSTGAGVYDQELVVVDSSVTSYDAVGLTNGTTYHFVVKAINPGGISTASNEVSATPQVPAPGAPILAPAVAGDTQIHLEWSRVDGSTGYKVYQSQTPGVYDMEVASVTGTVYSYDVTGLTNGESYNFVVKATNPGGDSAASNEVSAKPRTIPGAPTDVQAIAGNGQATITFKAPTDDGGSSVTGYEVTVSPGNVVVAGSNSPITITGLVNGTTYTFTVQAMNSAGKSAASTISNPVTPAAPTSGGGNNDGGSSSSQPSTPVPSDNLVDVLINGKAIHIGKVTKKQVNGQTVTTVTLDQKKLEEILAAEGRGAVIVIPVSNSDVAIGEINGQLLQMLEKAGVTLTLQSEKGSYTISAKQLGMNQLANRFGKDVVLQDIKVQIEIAVPSTDTLKKIQQVTSKGAFTLVATPLQFTVKAFYGSKSVELSKFDSYVERTIVLPDGADPNRITTAIVIEEDGSVRHVPTKIVRKDGKVVAIIHSLTNSTYAVIWHPVEFKDVAQHWAKDAITDMGSRMVVRGDDEGRFNPDQKITRAEFAAMLVRGLGLKLEGGESAFKDVLVSEWYQEVIQTAYAYHLINGYEDGQFRPMDQITREQAMVMIAQAMKLTTLSTNLPKPSNEEILRVFEDMNQASVWAVNGIVESVQAGVVSGRSSTQLAPQATITRAEVAVMLERLLQKSELI